MPVYKKENRERSGGRDSKKSGERVLRVNERNVGYYREGCKEIQASRFISIIVFVMTSDF